MASAALSSCKPNPVCQDANYTFTDPNFPRILTNASYYNGNASAYDWIVDQGQILHTNDNGGELVVTLSQENGGTRLSSTRFIHYGTITARVKTGRWQGVVSAFITMSNVKDEIDWEWPGGNITQAQTNYFWQGVRGATSNGKTVDGLSDTYANYHDYTIDWQPDKLTFSIDGNPVQTINQADTVTGGVSHYPNTPSRIQLSLWPAGINTSAPGTIQWAGGMINWQDPDYIASGHFFMRFNKITVKCGDSPPAGVSSYKYGGNSTAYTPTISFSNDSTILGVGGGVTIGAPALRHVGLLVIGGVLLAHLL